MAQKNGLKLTGIIAAIGKDFPKKITVQVLSSPPEEASQEQKDEYYVKLRDDKKNFARVKENAEVELFYIFLQYSPSVKVVIIESGSVTCHAAIVARELIQKAIDDKRVVIVGVEGAYTELKDDDSITIEISEDRQKATITKTKN